VWDLFGSLPIFPVQIADLALTFTADRTNRSMKRTTGWKEAASSWAQMHGMASALPHA
jgi:hypothetical protein